MDMRNRELAMVAAAEMPDEQGILLEGVSWNLYERLLEEVGDRHLFITFDKGRLEIMWPSWKHERYSELFGQLIRIIAREFSLPYIGGGSTTFRSTVNDCGLEPDRCFYIQNVHAVQGKNEIDLNIDPPPDLAVEIEISRRLSDRIEVYRKLYVPEIWCYDGTRLTLLHLRQTGYEAAGHSLAFPHLQIDQIPQLLSISAEMDELAWEDAVRAKLR
jgi:Uma2 family endonuclease